MESTIKTKLKGGYYVRVNFDPDPSQWSWMLSKSEAVKYMRSCRNPVSLMFVATDGSAMRVSY